MSVLVKGMEMPERCAVCPFRNIAWCREKIYIERRPECCPLVEVPTPHGRLIDADELKKEYPKDEDWEYPVNTNEYVCETIDDAKTVLEAEDG